MNFREHVFLAQCNQQRTIHTRMFLNTAQNIADACCLEWGHDFMGARGRRQICRRCGRGMIDVATASSTGVKKRPVIPILTAGEEEQPAPQRHANSPPQRGERRVFGRTR